MKPPIAIWCITDNKPGHRNQLRGLTAALAALLPVEVHWLTPPATPQLLWWWAQRRYPSGQGLPDPQLILGAGHATHAALLAARSARGGHAIVLMKPTLPTCWFDLCLIPQHDGATDRANIIATRGALHAVTPAAPASRRPRHGLFLIGGRSPHHLWQDDGVADQIKSIVQADPAWQWELTTSRRTPGSFLDRLGTLPGLAVTPVERTDQDWVPTRLARAATVWVTEDSVSMVYESLTAGAAVGLLHVPHRVRSRVVRGIESLAQDGLVTPFAQWRTGTAPHPPATVLHEAARCAALIRDRFLS